MNSVVSLPLDERNYLYVLAAAHHAAPEGSEEEDELARILDEACCRLEVSSDDVLLGFRDAVVDFASLQVSELR